MDKARDAWMEDIRQMNTSVRAASFELDAAKRDAKAAKAKWEQLQAELNDLIDRGPDRQAKLPFVDPEPAPTDLSAAGAVPAAVVSDAWKTRPVTVLQSHGVPESLATKLMDNGLETLGHLKERWDRTGGAKLDVKGVGPAKELTIVDAFADYGVAHPEIFGQPPLAPPEPAPEPTPDNENPFDDEPAAAAKPAPMPDPDDLAELNDDPFDDAIDDAAAAEGAADLEDADVDDLEDDGSDLFTDEEEDAA